MKASKEDTPKALLKLINSYESCIQSKGPVSKWTDSFLLKTRDKFRLTARDHRGSWTVEFYEVLQELNKESLKRGQPVGTK